DGGTGNFGVTHRCVAISEIQERPGHVHRQEERVAGGSFGSIHVAAKFGRHDGATRFAARRRGSNAAEKRMQRDLHFVIRIECLESGGVVCVVDWIEPNFLRKRRMQHRRVVGRIESTETWRKGADALVAVDLQVENVNGECIAWFGVIDEERTGKRIIALRECERVPRLLYCVTETI